MSLVQDPDINLSGTVENADHEMTYHLLVVPTCGSDVTQEVLPGEPFTLTHNYHDNQVCSWSFKVPSNRPVCILTNSNYTTSVISVTKDFLEKSKINLAK